MEKVIVKNFKPIMWYFDEKKYLSLVKEDFHIQNLVEDDYYYLYLLTKKKMKLISKSQPVFYNSLKGYTLKKYTKKRELAF